MKNNEGSGEEVGKMSRDPKKTRKKEKLREKKNMAAEETRNKGSGSGRRIESGE